MASKVIVKGMSKRKNEGKDDHLHKKGLGTPVSDKQLKQPSPPKPSHGVGEGLMMGKGPIAQGAIRRLLTHKEHAVKMVELIIKEMDLDPCADQTTEDLGALGLFDLSKVCFLFSNYVPTCYLSILLLMVVLISGIGAYEGDSRQVCRLRGGDPLVSKALGD